MLRITTFCISIALSTCILISTSHAESSLKGDYPACVSEELFDEMIIAIMDNDIQQAQYLLENGCIITKSGIPISILEYGVLGTTKVRAYLDDGDSVIIWTSTENIKR